MAYALDFYDPVLNIKDDIMRKLISSESLFKLVNDPSLEYPDDLPYKHIFPYIVDPTAIQDVINNIYFEAIDNGGVTRNTYLDHFYVDFLVICSSDLKNIKTESGMSRLDLLSHELCAIFQKSSGKWIGEMELVFNKPYTVPKNFLARILRFQFKDVNQC